MHIPPTLTFADLLLHHDSLTGELLFHHETMRQLYQANGYAEPFDPDVTGQLIAGWYFAHREAGGQVDPVAEELLAKCLAQSFFGKGIAPPDGQA